MIKTKNTLLALSLWSAMAVSAFAQGTAFTYQGQLISGGSPASGTYDVQFTLFSVSSGGSAIAGPVVQAAIGVTNGLFTTTVDFGSVFNGATNWLELAVRTNGAGSFSPALAPRQQLTPTPYAVYAEKANAAGLTGTVAAANLPANVALLNTSQTFTGSNNFAGPATITRSASGVPSGGSIDASTFLHVNNSATDGNTSSPDVAGIAFGNNSTRQAIVGGTFGNDYLDFYTGGLLTTPKMRIDINGNVGIGTDSPQWPLHVVGAGGGSSGIIAAETTGGNGGPQLRLKVGGPNSQEWVFVANGSINGPVGDLQIVQQSGGSRMVIRTNGNVGIGTTTPANKLDVQGSADFTGNVGIGNSTPETALHVGSYGSTNEYMTISTAGGNLYDAGIKLRHFNSGYGWTLDSNERDSSFRLYSHFNDTNGIVRMWVDRFSGSVGIGKTNPATLLDVNGEITCTAINITSDRNAKQDFTALNPRDVLAKVAALPITEWQYKAEKDKDSAAARHIGPMAQDFSAAFALGHDEKHISVIDEGGVALAAIQGLNEKVDEKDARIQELSQTVSELKTMVETMSRKMSQAEVK